MSNALVVDSLSVPFGAEPGLEAITFTVQPGERFVVIGASGAGKTTLLRGIAGLTPISGGTVSIGTRDITDLPAEQRDVVYLHQTPLLFPHLSVRENVAFPLRVRHQPETVIAERVRTLLGAVDLEGYAERRPATLSGGQRHRIALARALAARPAALHLDEPLAALDPVLRRDVREAILALQSADGRAGPALVIVTHDFEEAGLIGDRIAVLLDRRLAQIGPPAIVFARPASLGIARLLGIPNEIPGSVTAGNCFTSRFGMLALDRECTCGPGPAIAVVRADALRLTAPAEATVAGQIVEVRRRPERTTVVIDVDATAELPHLEVAVDPYAAPAAGTRHGLSLDPRGLWVVAPASGGAGR